MCSYLKKDQAYQYIKKNILDNLWDAEAPINVNQICAVLDMSRTPALEALTKLEHEGLVTITPQVGAFVRKPAFDEMFERLLVRASLEALTAEWAALRANQFQLEALEKILVQMEQKVDLKIKYADLNREFHRIINQAAGLPYLLALVDQHWDYFIYVSKVEHLFENDNRERSLAEHRTIFHSLKDGNGSLAKQLMENHITRVALLFKDPSKTIHDAR